MSERLKTKHISFRLEKETIATIKKMAKKQNITQSKLMTNAIRQMQMRIKKTSKEKKNEIITKTKNYSEDYITGNIVIQGLLIGIPKEEQQDFLIGLILRLTFDKKQV